MTRRRFVLFCLLLDELVCIRCDYCRFVLGRVPDSITYFKGKPLEGLSLVGSSTGNTFRNYVVLARKHPVTPFSSRGRGGLVDLMLGWGSVDFVVGYIFR